MLHEAEGVNVLLARFTAGHTAHSWLLHGNMVFQKPMSAGRDELDVVTSLGWARKLPHGVSLGAEMVGEDLEGFWDAEEAEGKPGAEAISSKPRCRCRSTPTVERIW